MNERLCFYESLFPILSNKSCVCIYLPDLHILSHSCFDWNNETNPESMIVSIFVYLYFFLVPENDFGSLSSCYIKAIVRRLSSPDHFWCFNPLGQFFNSVYTRGFLIQTLFTHARITQAATICLHLCRQDVQESLGSCLSFVLTRRRLIIYLYVLWCAIGYITVVHSIKLREDKRVTALVKTHAYRTVQMPQCKAIPVTWSWVTTFPRNSTNIAWVICPHVFPVVLWKPVVVFICS